MPNRILREGILTSQRIAALSWPAEVFYRRLMSVVDDFGRYYATPILLRAACYPLQIDKVSDSDIGKWIREAEDAALVRVYPAEDGKRYLELLDFRQQVRAKASKFPAAAADAQQMRSKCVAGDTQVLADAHLDVVVFGDGGEDSVEPQSDSPPPISLPAVNGKEVPIPALLVAEWESAYPAVDVMGELRGMRAWLLANPAKRKTERGMTSFANRWLAKEQDRGGRKEPSAANPWDGAK